MFSCVVSVGVFFGFFFFLENTVVMPTVTEQQAAATASDEAVCVLQLSWEAVTGLHVAQASSTILLNTAYVHRFGFCNYFVSSFQTQVLNQLARRELIHLVSIHACIQTLRCLADSVGICHDLN